MQCAMQGTNGSPGMVPLGLAATLIIGLCVTHHLDALMLLDL